MYISLFFLFGTNIVIRGWIVIYLPVLNVEVSCHSWKWLSVAVGATLFSFFFFSTRFLARIVFPGSKSTTSVITINKMLRNHAWWKFIMLMGHTWLILLKTNRIMCPLHYINVGCMSKLGYNVRHNLPGTREAEKLHYCLPNMNLKQKGAALVTNHTKCFHGTKARDIHSKLKFKGMLKATF